MTPYNPSTWEGEAGRSTVCGPPGWHGKDQASLSYIVRNWVQTMKELYTVTIKMEMEMRLKYSVT